MKTLNIPLSDDQQRLLREHAAKNGEDPTAYARRLIEEAIEREEIEAKLEEGLASGSLGEMTDADWERIQLEVERRVVERRGA